MHFIQFLVCNFINALSIIVLLYRGICFTLCPTLPNSFCLPFLNYIIYFWFCLLYVVATHSHSPTPHISTLGQRPLALLFIAQITTPFALFFSSGWFQCQSHRPECSYAPQEGTPHFPSSAISHYIALNPLLDPLLMITFPSATFTLFQ